MKIELWGTRGSLPSPLTNNDYQKRIRSIVHQAIKSGVKEAEIDTFIDSLPTDLSTVFGGNTTCVSVTSKRGNIHIIDAGSGIRALGDKLMEGEAGQGKAVLNFFITHTHWDHIQGLPFFKPVYIPNNRIIFHSPIKELHTRLQYQQDFRFFPREFDNTDSIKEFKLLKLGEPVEVEPGLLVDFVPLKHPGGSVAYRFREDGKTFIFATDVEIRGDAVESYTPEYNDFFTEADLLIIDSQYTLDEAFLKFDWGHTSYTMAVNCGMRWKVKQLLLTHHEPSYSESKLMRNLDDALLQLRNEATKEKQPHFPQLNLATEGMVITL